MDLIFDKYEDELQKKFEDIEVRRKYILIKKNPKKTEEQNTYSYENSFPNL